MKNLVTPVLLVYLILSNQLFGHGMSEAEKQVISDGGNFEFIYIGMIHMLSGYDHLLFVFGMIFFLKSFKDVLKVITAFTLGHSITLIWATFNLVAINYFLIDAVIALSLCLIGIVNILKIKKSLHISINLLVVVIVILGLIHGLGLSTRLQELPLDQNNLLLNIISFNIGIEFGQFIALSFMLIFLFLFKKSSFSLILTYFINSLIIITGILLFIFQINEYIHSNKPINYKDTISVIIPALGEKEYKLWIEKDEKMQYSWQSENKERLYYDFHGEPASDLTGYFKSYKESISFKDNGELIAPFVGTHGWYWKNETSKPIKIILKVNGIYKCPDCKKNPQGV